MADLLTIENLGNLAVLIFLQAVLGFDNLLYISIESQRAPAAVQKRVRFWGIIIAVVLRVVLLFVMIKLIDAMKDPLLTFGLPGYSETIRNVGEVGAFIKGGVNFSTIVFIIGGVFIMYTAFKEIAHMLSMEHLENDPTHKKGGKSAAQVVTMIVMMNLVFSFDSILSALAITDVFPVLAIAILASGAAMLLLADGVTEFLKKNRMYEVLGLFILLIVGVVLLGESGTAAAHAMHDDALQIAVFGYDLIPMSKTTFYFSVVVLVIVELVQTGYQRKLAAERLHEQSNT